MIFPNTVARLDELGVLTALHAAHNVPRQGFRIVAFGNDIKGYFTPIGGHDKMISPRRTALDKVLVDCALAAGVEGRFGTKVVDVIGSGTDGDPTTGVVLENGEEIHAKWVFGADGRASKVAGKLGIEQTRQQSGEVSYLLAFWRGIPNDGYCSNAIRSDAILSSWACEDGQHLLTTWGDPDYTHGSKEVLLERYLDDLRTFPEILDPEALDKATMVSELFVAPESIMRGYFRKTNGPGWALVGDACHFKHPGTAQGIGDAIAQAVYVADSVTGSDPELAEYESWRDERAAEHYDWSFAWGQFPKSPAPFKGWATEEDAGQDMRDSFSRHVKPSAVLTQERLARWFATESEAVDA
jgi:2-polyprenyl-6-methoxyphenol hydroxylase-like FAD-dependent oxidoreductase